MKTQQNTRWRLCGDKDETINYISECSKLAQKEYTRLVEEDDLHWELCKKLKFDHTNEWYMHNQESVLENETHKRLWHFQIQANVDQTTRPSDTLQKEVNLPNSGICYSSQKKKKRKER